ncbi:DUF3984 domain-containing protein [Aspergillus brunneoviolaceus CBS 621.78]|uniref:Uncharacterized protein n=1 Tax=Aspergillus brunneoviolaceus CBS 621.78 TaxID=1450534 RepID=A0ACD1FXE7_9EURO|nr:hypothetical protein BO95DRAFT_446760 [Aspergillus brunneoviolaceus CBS 621.78]RAH41613.1 hypothetical protein BO95DRAFT_446760 [Aspergillus brunneoviolaceus CBS 621.78]
MEQTQVPAQPPVQSAFRSRRSYPSLHHVSLAPLNPRFLADEEGEEEAEVPDYFNHPHHNHHDSPDPPTARSYLASFSVPGTPGVLSHSHSRSGSRTRHHPRSKSSSRIHHASDPNLQARSASSPLHHHHNQQQQHQPHQTHHTNRSTRTRHPANHHQDTEWMLRAGIALASSTREEKGQSWLVKRQSSTSLVSDDHQLSLDFLNHNHNHHHHHHSWSHGGSPRHGRSGRSTPAAANSRSRRASRSRPSSRVASRADLAMTSLGMATTATSTAASSRRESRTADRLTSTSTQKIEEKQQQQQQNRPLIPDFVDERIRAEMASIQRDENAKFDEEEEIDDDLSSFTSDYPYLDSGDESVEIDEQELQRLTRERGFGLGSWIDRMVEWTLFGVEDWPLSFGGGGGGTGNDGTVVESRTITIADHPPHPSADNVENDPSSTHVAVAATPSIGADDTDTISIAESEVLSVCEKPGDQGGWGDAGWLFRVVKRALS